MANLLPTTEFGTIVETEQNATVKFGRSWKFDFEKREFITSPTGKMAPADELEAYMEWCQKALMTCRYKHMIYTRDYGNEFEDLIGKGYPRSVVESEIKRIATDTLMYDPRTESVSDFSFTWVEDAIYFDCQVTPIFGQIFNVGSKVVI